MPRVALHTLGCKLNYAETSMLGKQFVERGFDVVAFEEQADVYLINTCSVTERADRECRQIIRRAKRRSGQSFIIVTGCYAQLEPEEVASIEGVDAVLGATEKFQLFDHLSSLKKSGGYPQVFVSDITQADNFGIAYSTSATDRTRAFLKVQDGCDYNCSFCTIPLARGASRGQSVDACVEQATQLVESGYKETVLTGVNVGDYGKKNGTTLAALLRRLTAIDGLERIRISSIEPNLLTDEILDLVAREKKLCNHFHIPLQSGSDEILRLMRRRYNTQQYSDLIHRIRSTIPDCGIGVDVIVGFPGETDNHFKETHLYLADLQVSYLHVFTYSERPNTPAAGFRCSVEPRKRFKRNEELRILSQKKKQTFYQAMVGRTVEVLMESSIDENGMRSGLTDTYVRVALPEYETMENTLVNAEITSVVDERCVGRLTNRDEGVTQASASQPIYSAVAREDIDR